MSETAPALRNSPYWVARVLADHLQAHLETPLSEALDRVGVWLRDTPYLARQQGLPLTLRIQDLAFRTAPELIAPPPPQFIYVLPEVSQPSPQATEETTGLPSAQQAAYGRPGHTWFEHALTLYCGVQSTAAEAGLAPEETRDLKAQVITWATYNLLLDPAKTRLLKQQHLRTIAIGELAFGRSRLPGTQPIFTSYGAVQLVAYTY